MSLTVTTDVFCDGLDPDGYNCAMWINGAIGSRRMVLEARKNAQRGGWMFVRHNGEWKDLCPACQKELGIPAKKKQPTEATK